MLGFNPAVAETRKRASGQRAIAEVHSLGIACREFRTMVEEGANKARVVVTFEPKGMGGVGNDKVTLFPLLFFLEE